MRVLLADDEPTVRSALRLLLEHQPGLTIAGEVDHGQALLEMAAALLPDMVLVDWELPGGPGKKLLAALHSLTPCLRIVALSGRPEARQAALLAGADAVASKGDPPEVMLAALQTAAEQHQP